MATEPAARSTLIVNNQVGFTTAPDSSRSTVYASDVARMVQAPIFHVNGDDPRRVRVATLAFDFRQRFNKDVVIDMVCYRKRGHNEADDPSLTQPLMYNIIDAKRSVRKIYTESLIGRGDITVEEAEEALRDYQSQLERVFAETREDHEHHEVEWVPQRSTPRGIDVHQRRGPSRSSSRARLTYLKASSSTTACCRNCSAGRRWSNGTIDWGMGETLAFGSILLDGQRSPPVRSGFAPRHVRATPFRHRRPRDGFGVHAAEAPFQRPRKVLRLGLLLSEFAAMGFEYGYSVANPRALVLWESAVRRLR